MGALIRAVVTVAVFVLIFRHVDLGGVGRTLAGADPWLLLPALLFQLASTTVAAFRWHRIMAALGLGVGPGSGFTFYLRSYFKGMFFNQALPTSIGGDALRMLDVARLGHRKRDAFYGVAVDRGVGLFGLLLVNLAALAANPHLLPEAATVPIAVLVTAGVVGFLLLLLARRVPQVGRWRVLALVHDLSTRLGLVFRDGEASAGQVVLAVGIHLLAMVGIFFLGRAVGLGYDLATFLVIVPPAILLTVIPISLAGWGVREGAMVGLFTLIGANKTAVLSMSILYGLVLIVVSLPGFYVYMSGKK